MTSLVRFVLRPNHIPTHNTMNDQTVIHEAIKKIQHLGAVCDCKIVLRLKGLINGRTLLVVIDE